MLRYKLRHLCSRVVASLSALGLMSISGGDAAGATIYQPGQKFVSYNYANNLTMSSSYEAGTNSLCVTHSDVGPYVDGAGSFQSGESESYCRWECPVGFMHRDANGQLNNYISGVVPTSSGILQTFTLQSGCIHVMSAKCVPSANATAVTTTNLSGSGVSCEFKCNQGYHVEGQAANVRDVTEKVVPGAAMSSDGKTYTMQARCVPNNYTITYDCGEGTIADELGGKSTYSQTVTYNAEFEIPAKAICTRNGYNFKGWSSPQSFTKK